jgi:transposase
MRFVQVKSVEQQDIQATHRIRSELIGQRTAKANQIRGLVSEYGLVAPQQIQALRKAIPQWLEDGDNDLTGLFRRLLNGLWGDLKVLDDRIGELSREIESIALNNPVATRLQTLRGVGPMIATALIAAVGDAQQFTNGRQMAASLGLTPRQHSPGNKERLLVHGARSAVYAARNKEDRLSQWVIGLAARRHTNVAAVALANKTVRMAWALLRNGTEYEPGRV